MERDQLGEFNAGRRYCGIVWFAEETLHTLVLYNTYMITGNAVFRQFFSGIQMWKAQEGEKKILWIVLWDILILEANIVS